MPSYAVYIRTKEGYIERMKNVVSHLPSIAPPSFRDLESLRI